MLTIIEPRPAFMIKLENAVTIRTAARKLRSNIFKSSGSPSSIAGFAMSYLMVNIQEDHKYIALRVLTCTSSIIQALGLEGSKIIHEPTYAQFTKISNFPPVI